MIEHEQLLKLAIDKDDYPVMLYLAEIGKVIDWKGSLPDEVLYIPEEIFQSVACEFVKTIGLKGYYNKVVLNELHIEKLCCQREPSETSEGSQITLTAIRDFIKSAAKKSTSHYLAFEGP